jgi:hypothetical protein
MFNWFWWYIGISCDIFSCVMLEELDTIHHYILQLLCSVAYSVDNSDSKRENISLLDVIDYGGDMWVPLN